MSEPAENPFALDSEYARLVREAAGVVRLEVSFPEYAFTRRDGSVRFTDVIDRGWYELRDFAELHGDRELSLIVLDPAADLDKIAGPGRRLAFTLSTRVSSDTYYDALRFNANRDEPFCIQDIAMRVAIWGSSGRWAVFGERDLVAWWSDKASDEPGIQAWEIRRRPWAYTAEQALELWGLGFKGLAVPGALADRFRQNYQSFDRATDPEEGLPYLAPWDRRDEP